MSAAATAAAAAVRTNGRSGGCRPLSNRCSLWAAWRPPEASTAGSGKLVRAGGRLEGGVAARRDQYSRLRAAVGRLEGGGRLQAGETLVDIPTGFMGIPTGWWTFPPS